MARRRKKQGHTGRDQQRDQQVQREPQPVAPLDQQVHRTDGQSEGDQQQPPRKRRKPKRRLRVMEVAFAGAVAFFALVQACVSYWQWTVMSQSNEQARRAAEGSQRAWVLASGFETLTPPSVEADGMVAITIKNVGTSPANIRFTGTNVFSSDPLAKRVLDFPPGPPKSEGLIGPGMETGVNVILDPIRQDRAAEYDRDELHVYIFAFVTYTDAFNVPRHTVACRRFHRTTNAWIACPVGFERFD